jgi:anti-sigma regulatory factor (Ser/Thr protein kinase)
MRSIKLPAIIENLERFNDFVLECARNHAIPFRKTHKLQVAIEEALVNIFQYAYPDGPGDVELRCLEGPEGTLVLEIIDTGIPFDPRVVEDPDIESGIDDREVGGLGIFLIKNLVDELDYRREGNINILRLMVYKNEE